MGPGDGIQKQRLLDLPTTIETADQPNQQRVITGIRHAPPPPRAPPRPTGLPPLNGITWRLNNWRMFKKFILFL